VSYSGGPARRLAVEFGVVVLLAGCTVPSFDGTPPPAPDTSASPAPGPGTPSAPVSTAPAAARNPYDITQAQPNHDISLTIAQATVNVGGTPLERYQYTDSPGTAYGAGLPIVVAAGQPVRIAVANQTDTVTNVHWHGLTVPNDQDGPDITISPGQTHHYQFTVAETGTYWYHSHERPVRDQVGQGMYGPLVVQAAEDAAYDLDQILVLNDWVVHGAQGRMEVIGDTDMVNGLTGEAIPPLRLAGGQIAKLRLINASTARTQGLTFPFDVRVTHIDGYPLSAPRTTRVVSIPPGGRADVEVALTGQESATYTIINDREAGMRIPVQYIGNAAPAARSPFTPAPSQPVDAALEARTPDITMDLGEAMGGMMGGRGMGGGMMTWTINGQVYPDTGTYPVALGQTYIVRFINQGMERIAHPMHIHGTHFQILSVNGHPTRDDTWYDTYDVPYGGATDIAVSFTEPGMWMVHCLILDHEDGGMMASFTAG
jgi:FtsP/CotA-like multicopper oxidase with cupredoxin domain